MKIKNSFWVGALVIQLGLLAGGCNRAPVTAGIEAEELQNLPADLRRMQGCWMVKEDTAAYSCEVICEGYTMRIKYCESGDETGLKRNARIQEFHGNGTQFTVYSDKLPWSYYLDSEEGMDTFNLSFYDDSQKNWVYMEMQRVQGNAIAGL